MLALASAPALAFLFAPISLVSAVEIPTCQPIYPDGPYFVDSICQDPVFDKPMILEERDIDLPIPHRRVLGKFDNTSITFSVYLPAQVEFANRFFQYIYPLSTGNATDESILFSADQGSYTVSCSGSLGYRQDAATAKFSRQIARQFYGLDNSSIINGYTYGSSGGSLQCVGALENTQDVWQGGVPYIQAIPTSIPNHVSSLAMCTLLLEGKSQAIADAILPGGDQEPERMLTALERATFKECSALGLPPRQWETLNNWVYDSGLLRSFYPSIYSLDPTYANDFWNAPGYVGTEETDLGRFIRERRRSGSSSIVEISVDESGQATFLKLPDVRSGYSLSGAELSLVDCNGTVLKVLPDLPLELRPSSEKVMYNVSGLDFANATILATPGLRLLFDNSKFLAAHFYARHQLPLREGFSIYDQYRQDHSPAGTPMYPQRSPLVHPLIASGPSGGGNHTGLLKAKTIVVQNLLDVNSPPWNADWYRGQVERAMGPDASVDTYRLWFTDNADHPGASGLPGRQNVVDYSGILFHALYHLHRWVEKGIEPPYTNYQSKDAQITVPKEANQRGGVQPVARLRVGGADEQIVRTSCNEAVQFEGSGEVPFGQGGIVRAEWDHLGTGNFTSVLLAYAEDIVNFSSNFTYAEPGTYFATFRIASVYDGDPAKNYSLAYNMDRARVVVSC